MITNVNIAMPPKISDTIKGFGKCQIDKFRGHHYYFNVPKEFLESEEYKSGKITSYEATCICGKKWSE